MLPFVTCAHIVLYSFLGLREFSVGIGRSLPTYPYSHCSVLPNSSRDMERGLEKKVGDQTSWGTEGFEEPDRH